MPMMTMKFALDVSFNTDTLPESAVRKRAMAAIEMFRLTIPECTTAQVIETRQQVIE